MWLGIMPDDRPQSPLNETTRVFGERVRDRRLALGLSQEAAAVRCGIHWTQLGKVERGQRSLRLETALASTQMRESWSAVCRFPRVFSRGLTRTNSILVTDA